MAQSKQELTRTSQASQDAGEGGRAKNPDAASPSAERPRNSSGSASVAASLLDMRQHINAIEHVLYELKAMQILDGEHFRELELLRQRGFRRGR
jgi:hypothetical protein